MNYSISVVQTAFDEPLRHVTHQNVSEGIVDKLQEYSVK
jgi:hypothetical protein